MRIKELAPRVLLTLGFLKGHRSASITSAPSNEVNLAHRPGHSEFSEVGPGLDALASGCFLDLADN